jgi:hypothetical protein
VSRRITAAVAVALACAVGAPLAQAQVGSGADPVIAARTLGYQGIEAYQAGNYLLADDRLGRAYQLLPVPSLGLWSARTLVKLNFLVAASRRYAEVLGSRLASGDAAVQQQARREAEQELAALRPQIPSVQVRLEGAVAEDVAVTINGVRVESAALGAAIPVDPGERIIEGRRGQQLVRVRLQVLAQQRGAVLLDFREPPGGALSRAAPMLGLGSAGSAPTIASEAGHGSDTTWRTTGWIALGVGGSALLFSGVAGLIAWNKQSDLDCSRHPCRSSSPEDVDTYNALVRASTVGYLAGGVVAGAGVLLLWRYPAQDLDVTVGLGPTSATLGGRF